MEDLKFLDSEVIGECYDNIEQILYSSNLNLLIDMQNLPRDVSSVDVRSNLLQVTVAIQNTNFEFIESGQPLHDDVLRKLLSKLKIK